MPALGPAHQYLYSLRRSAKQHLAAAKCPCEWDWYGVLEGQLEDRPDLDEETLRRLWERREPCPALHAEGGGALADGDHPLDRELGALGDLRRHADLGTPSRSASRSLGSVIIFMYRQAAARLAGMKLTSGAASRSG